MFYFHFKLTYLLLRFGLDFFGFHALKYKARVLDNEAV